jgi:transposase-like protein
MAARYSEEFKQQAVQKLLNRGQGVTMEDTATALGVAMSSLYRWMTDFQRTTLNGHNNKKMTKPENTGPKSSGLMRLSRVMNYQQSKSGCVAL